MSLFLRFSLLLLAVFIVWAVIYLATLGAGDTSGSLPASPAAPDAVPKAMAKKSLDSNSSSQSQVKQENQSMQLDGSNEQAIKSVQPESAPPELDPEVAETMRDMSKRNSDGLEAEISPNGSVKVRLDGRYKSVVGAVVDEQGKLHVIEGAPAKNAVPAND